MRYLRLIGMFIQAAVQAELAYRANFAVHLLYTSFNILVAWTSLVVLFGQVPVVRGWDYPSTLALLGVYLTIVALRGLCLGPSLDSLAGLDGELWTGRFDFTLLRPVDVQFMASLRVWRPLALLDLALGLAVIARAAALSPGGLDLPRLAMFGAALAAGILLIYAALLAFSSLAFWSPGLLFTWVFDALLQLARYPVAIYPAWLRMVLTWLVPVGLITTVPAQALTGQAAGGMVLASLLLALAAVAGASLVFRTGVKRYASASS